MGLLKKFFCLILLFSLLAAFFPLPSRAANSDIDIDFTKNAQTIFDIEDYLKRQQDTYLHYIKAHNSQVIQVITNYFNNGKFFYITIDYDSSKNDHIYFYITFYNYAYYNANYPQTNYYFYKTILKDQTTLTQNNAYAQIGTFYSNYVDSNNLSCITLELSDNDNINSWDYTNNYTNLIPTCLIGYTSDYFYKIILGDSNNGGSSSNDYSDILYNMQSDLSSLRYNSNSIMGDIANVKNYANYINNKLTTTNTYLSNIQGAINNGSSTITNTIVSTHNNDNSNDNKNTNEIITAINDNTNVISNIQVTNDNSDLINAINNGFSNLNSNNNTNKNEIVSTINSASEDIQDDINNNTNSIVSSNNSNKNEIVSSINNASEDISDGQINNTNSIISNSNSNTNDIVEAIEGVTITGGSGGITNTEYNQGVTAINDNNDENTNRILDNQVTEEDADIFSNIDVPEFDDPLPNLSNTLNNFFNSITSSDKISKTFDLMFKNKRFVFTLDYNLLYDNLFSKNIAFYSVYKALWWAVFGFYIYKKLRIFYNKCIAGEWDEVVTAFDDSDEVIGRSVK